MAETIEASGLSAYYLDRERASQAPAAVPEALATFTAWDHPAAQKDIVALQGEKAAAELTLENLSCAACAWRSCDQCEVEGAKKAGGSASTTARKRSCTSGSPAHSPLDKSGRLGSRAA